MHPGNAVQLIGTLERDPVYVTTGGAADLTVIYLETRVPTTTAGNENVQRHRCVAWGPAALALFDHLHAGDRLGLRGSLNYVDFHDELGVLRRRTEIRVEDFTFLD